MSSAPRVLKKWKAMLDYGYQFMCGICDKPIEHRDELSVDHIHPLSLGGKNHHYNYQPAHVKCNNRRGNKPIKKTIIQGGYQPVAPNVSDKELL
jgi:5-methylcytosine-specific restriction endonuclease McrA